MRLGGRRLGLPRRLRGVWHSVPECDRRLPQQAQKHLCPRDWPSREDELPYLLKDGTSMRLFSSIPARGGEEETSNALNSQQSDNLANIVLDLRYVTGYGSG
jgi:hypothetical protein